MKLGTVRVGEAQAYDAHGGWQQFHAADTQEPHGSFEVFWHGGGHMAEQGDDDMALDDWRDPEIPGWYWHACFPGCMPDGEPVGPFAYSQQAHEDADEWSPDYDEGSS